jgi:methyl-accepting chemotaxis protein
MMAERVEQLTVLVELPTLWWKRRMRWNSPGKPTREQAQQQARLAIGSFVKDDVLFRARFQHGPAVRAPERSSIGVPQRT